MKLGVGPCHAGKRFLDKDWHVASSPHRSSSDWGSYGLYQYGGNQKTNLKIRIPRTRHPNSMLLLKCETSRIKWLACTVRQIRSEACIKQNCGMVHV